MDKIKEVIIGVIITFVLQIVLSLIINSLSNDNGFIIQGSVTQMDSIYVQNIIVSNTSKKEIDNIVFEIEHGTLQKYISNKNINVKLNDSAKNRIYQIPKIFAQSINEIFLYFKPIGNNKGEPNVRFLNAVDNKLALKNSSDYFDDETFWKQILLNSIITAILYGIALYILLTISGNRLKAEQEKIRVEYDKHQKTLGEMEKKIDEANENLAKSKLETEKLHKDFETLHEKADGVRTAFSKIQILTSKKIRDLIKENEFYTVLLKKILDAKEIKTDNDFAKVITEELRTYSAKASIKEGADFVDIYGLFLESKRETDK